jgi:AcrR family transcriptional regulator
MVAQINSDDPRVKRTRQLLHQAVLDLLNEKPFRNITVQDIADRATVNRATFYAHYEDKYALMEGCARDQFQQALAGKLPANAGWSLGALRVLLLTIFGFMAHTHHDCAPSDREFDPLLQQLILGETYTILIGWFRLPGFPGGPSGVSPDTLATVWSWSMFGAASQWSQGTRQTPAEQVADAVLATLTRSLGRR